MLVNLLSPHEKAEVISYCFHRYGVETNCWDNLHCIKTKDALWGINSQMLAFSQNTNCYFESMGTRCFSGRSFPYKITDGFVKLFFKHINKGQLELNQLQVLSMLRGETINDESLNQKTLNGYVILYYGRTYIGIGLKKGDQLISQIPKSFRSQLGKKLEIRN